MEKKNGIGNGLRRLVMLPHSAFNPVHPVNPVSISAFPFFFYIVPAWEEVAQSRLEAGAPAVAVRWKRRGTRNCAK